jgi:hypothetical protein
MVARSPSYATGKSFSCGDFARQNVDAALVDFLFEIVQFGFAFVFVNIDIPGPRPAISA